MYQPICNSSWTDYLLSDKSLWESADREAAEVILKDNTDGYREIM